jgi:protein-S-isoprenylcysteine O-methyltransferase Ste14
MDLLAGIAWLAFLAVWGIGAITTKRTARPMPLGAFLLHVAVLALALAILLVPALRSGILGRRVLPDEPWVENFGYALQIAGIAACIWARVHLGRNWSSVAVVKEDHKLIRSGPYAFVRHPIYSGLLLALLGEAIDHREVGGLVAIGILVIEWKRKSLIEERLMLEQFGGAYKRYRAEVKGLIPGIW